MTYHVSLNAFIQNGPAVQHGFTDSGHMTIAADSEAEAIHKAYSTLAESLDPDQRIMSIFPSVRPVERGHKIGVGSRRLFWKRRLNGR